MRQSGAKNERAPFSVLHALPHPVNPGSDDDLAWHRPLTRPALLSAQVRVDAGDARKGSIRADPDLRLCRRDSSAQSHAEEGGGHPRPPLGMAP